MQGSVDFRYVWDRNSDTSDTEGGAKDWDRCAGLDEGKLARSQKVNNQQLIPLSSVCISNLYDFNEIVPASKIPRETNSSVRGQRVGCGAYECRSGTWSRPVKDDC